ncbi:hypothetical protein CHU95_17620 [Niveispirillum lacus]|uniref:Uncharacterized protein n=1 Tax=Niveispirillum lacus TaxID=1981099 RepID=A0A255YTQ4_9PROT|nr:hypothetical protein [Niveispirillum lacus]OYQ32598.1 hypothetical protein CHU95_17620 [Niveispirillum lacus]
MSKIVNIWRYAAITVKYLSALCISLSVILLWNLSSLKQDLKQDINTDNYTYAVLGFWIEKQDAPEKAERSLQFYQSSIESLSSYLGQISAAASAIFTLFSIPLGNSNKYGSLCLIPLSFWNNELIQMEKYYKNSKKVVVYAGDFSWLVDYSDLNYLSRAYNRIVHRLTGSNIFIVSEKLARDGKLFLHSHKSHPQVEAALQGHINKFIHNFQFDCPLQANFSLVYYEGKRVLLYLVRHYDMHGCMKAKNLLVVSETEETQTLFKLIEKGVS